MVNAVLTHQNIPTGYRLLPTADTPSSLRGLSSKPGLDLISRTASIDYHSLSLTPSLHLTRSRRLSISLCSIRGPSIRSVRVIPGSNSSQSRALILEPSNLDSGIVRAPFAKRTSRNTQSSIWFPFLPKFSQGSLTDSLDPWISERDLRAFGKMILPSAEIAIAAFFCGHAPFKCSFLRWNGNASGYLRHPSSPRGRRRKRCAKKWNFLEMYRSPKTLGSASPSHPSFGCPLGSLAIPHELSPLVDLLSFLVAVVPGWQWA